MNAPRSLGRRSPCHSLRTHPVRPVRPLEESTSDKGRSVVRPSRSSARRRGVRGLPLESHEALVGDKGRAGLVACPERHQRRSQSTQLLGVGSSPAASLVRDRGCRIGLDAAAAVQDRALGRSSQCGAAPTADRRDHAALPNRPTREHSTESRLDRPEHDLDRRSLTG